MESTNSSRSKRRRTIPHYRDALDQEDITVPEDLLSVQDLAVALEESNLQEILDLAKKHGYDSVFDLCNKVLQRRDKDSVKYVEEWMQKDGTAQLLASCRSHPKFNGSPTLSDEVCSLAEDVYRREFKEIAKELPNRIQRLSLEAITNFSLGNVWTTIQRTVPRFKNMLQP
jgi:hypothetical protein